MNSEEQKTVIDIWSGPALFVVLFGFYVVTAYPTLPPGDSGEFITAVHLFGLPHPPGYPLYVLLARVITEFLPFGNPAYRLNIVSGIFSASAALVLYKALRVVKVSPIAAFISLLLAFISPGIVDMSHAAEVFSLHNLFLAIIIFLGLSYIESGKQRFMFLCAFLMGLGLCNHQTLVLAMPAVIYCFWPRIRQEPAVLLWCAGLFMIGFSVQLFIYSRGQAGVPFNMSPAHNLQELLDVILRRRYGTFRLQSASAEHQFSVAAIADRIGFLYGTIIKQIGMLAAAVALFGAWRLYSSNRKVLVFLGLIFTFTPTIFFVIANAGLGESEREVLRRFMLPGLLMAGLWGAVGIDAILAAQGGLPRPRACVALAVILASVIPTFYANILRSDRRDYYYLADLMDNLGRALPQSSVVVMRADDNYAFASFYYTHVLRKRTDVARVSWFDRNDTFRATVAPTTDIVPPDSADASSKKFDSLVAWNHAHGRPVYVFANASNLIPQASSRFVVETMGLFYEVGRSSSGSRMKSVPWAWDMYAFRAGRNQADAETLVARDTLMLYGEMLKWQADSFLERNQYELAVSFARRALSFNDKDHQTYNFQGVALERLGQMQDAELAYQEALALKPDYMSAAFNLAQFYYTRREYLKAKQCLEPLMSRQTTYLPAYMLMFKIYKSLGDSEKVREYAERGRALSRALKSREGAR